MILSNDDRIRNNLIFPWKFSIDTWLANDCVKISYERHLNTPDIMKEKNNELTDNMINIS